jgi:hypothetical protein
MEPRECDGTGKSTEVDLGLDLRLFHFSSFRWILLFFSYTGWPSHIRLRIALFLYLPPSLGSRR